MKIIKKIDSDYLNNHYFILKSKYVYIRKYNKSNQKISWEYGLNEGVIYPDHMDIDKLEYAFSKVYRKHKFNRILKE
jgi:hypothetical protein